MKTFFRVGTLVFSALFLHGCDQSGSGAPTGDEIPLSIWAHAGQAAERQVLQRQVERFRRLNPDITVDLTFIPERSYNAQVQAAAVAGDLPDVLELDGPFLYNYVWQGHLGSLEGVIDGRLRDDLLPSILAQGSWRGALYGVGTFDSGLALFARRSLLEAAGARVPEHPDEAWTVDEFDDLLHRLAGRDDDGAVLDLKLNYPDEWFTYAFSPVLQSGGADLIERPGYTHAAGVINGPSAVQAMTVLQSWLAGGLVDPNVDDAAFTAGRVALSWAGHWEYPRYGETFGDDLVLVPLPDFGAGARTGQGSWVWGVSQAARHPQAAARFLQFLLVPEEVLAVSKANGAVPATYSAIERSPLYAEGGALRLFVIQLARGYAVPRPQTPAYPTITSAFRRAFADIRNGEGVQAALDRAATAIDQDIRDNKGYRPAAGP